jgi:hypothetical protein
MSTDAVSADILDWSDGDGPETCPVHHVPLVTGVVPIRYGLGADMDASQDVERGVPYARDFVSGGCILDKHTLARVHYCEACRRQKRLLPK